MTAPRKTKLTRRAALATLAGAGALGSLPGERMAVAQGQEPDRPPQEVVPITGKAGPGLEPFDGAMLEIMNRHGVPGAALAIAQQGKLVLARGYGWSNIEKGEAVQPETLFGLASLSKPFTAVAALLLVEQGKLGLDDRVLDILKYIRPLRGAREDPRLRSVTVHHCLNHSGGWDRRVSGDAINWEPQICRLFRLRAPLSPRQLIEFILDLPLNFVPGTNAVYSNVGYVLLGEVIARVSGMPYERFVREQVLRPMGITRARLHSHGGRYLAGEALRYLAGTLLSLPPMNLPMVDAAGGWVASVVDLARFLTSLDGSRGEPVLSAKMRKQMLEAPPAPLQPRPDGTYFGLGWDSVRIQERTFSYFKDGLYQGIRTYMKRLPNGLNWALLYNASLQLDPLDREIVTRTVKEVHDLIEGFGKYPDIDLFKEYL